MPELAALSTSIRAGTECEPSLRLFIGAANLQHGCSSLRGGNRKKGASPANPPFLATDLQGWAATNWPQGVRKVWLYSPNGVGEVQCAGFSLSVSVSLH